MKICCSLFGHQIVKRKSVCKRLHASWTNNVKKFDANNGLSSGSQIKVYTTCIKSKFDFVWSKLRIPSQISQCLLIYNLSTTTCKQNKNMTLTHTDSQIHHSSKILVSPHSTLSTCFQTTSLGYSKSVEALAQGQLRQFCCVFAFLGKRKQRIDAVTWRRKIPSV